MQTTNHTIVSIPNVTQKLFHLSIVGRLVSADWKINVLYLDIENESKEQPTPENLPNTSTIETRLLRTV